MLEDSIYEENEEQLSSETLEEVAEKRKKRRYILYAVMGGILIIVILIAAFVSSNSNKEEEVKPSEASDLNVSHPIVEMARIKNVPLQAYNVTAPLIANTPQELVLNINVDGWAPGLNDYSVPGLSKKYMCLECPKEKEVNIWLKIYSNDQDGRKELYTILEEVKKNNETVVSEIAEMGSGGFIVNDNKTLSYWFYYEPNIVARVGMSQEKQGTLQETREWAHRLNYSIYKVVGR